MQSAWWGEEEGGGGRSRRREEEQEDGEVAEGKEAENRQLPRSL